MIDTRNSAAPEESKSKNRSIKYAYDRNSVAFERGVLMFDTLKITERKPLLLSLCRFIIYNSRNSKRDRYSNQMDMTYV